MPPVNRRKPVRAKSSESRYSLMDFKREFPDDDACLDWLWRKRYSEDGQHAWCPKCERQRRFHRLSAHPAYACDACGHHIHPTAKTIFHKSSTSLWLWFYAMFLMTSTKTGLSAKQLERQIGVTYKTAWRMLNRIRNQLMQQPDDLPLGGAAEVDETYWGGKPKASQTRGMTRPEAITWGKRRKTPIVGMVERGGRARLIAQPEGGALDAIRRHVGSDATIVTDDWAGYRRLSATHADHHTIAHSDRIYGRGWVHTNTVEGFFGNVKRGIGGNNHHVSRKWLQGYLNEFCWRYNYRHDHRGMFRALMLVSAAP